MKKSKKEKINIILRIIFTTMLILTCIIIFDFSKQTGGTSGSLSRDVMKFIAEIFTNDAQKIAKIVSRGEPILRKIAHFTVYTSLGVWAMCMMQTYFKKNKKTNINNNDNDNDNTSDNSDDSDEDNDNENDSNNIDNSDVNDNIENVNYYSSKAYDKVMKKRMLISVIIGFLYAVSDEIHQSFIPNRSARIIDVFLDTLGVTNGILIVTIIVFIYNHYKNVTKELK